MLSSIGNFPFIGKLVNAVAGILASIGLLTNPLVGVAVPQTPALIDTYLAAAISTTDTSMTLANGTTKAGTALSGYTCFVIDANSPTTEYVCGTASSTSVTSLQRGIDLSNPNSTSSALAYSHRRFSSVSISDYPTLQFLVRRVNGTDSFESVLKYDNPKSFSASSSIIDKNYADNLAIAGAPDASSTSKGIVEIATQNELATGASAGNTSAPLVPEARFFNATSSPTSTAVVTDGAGKISPTFIPTSTSYSWTGTHAFLASTTLASTTQISGTLNITSASSTISAPTTFTNTVNLQGAVTGIATETIEELAEMTLSAPASSTFVANLPWRRHLYVYFRSEGQSAADTWAMTFNNDNDGGNLYGYSSSTANSADSIYNASVYFTLRGSRATTTSHLNFEIDNTSSSPKFVWGTVLTGNPQVLANAPLRGEFSGVYASTTAAISTVMIRNLDGANFNVGSRLTVYGSRE